MSVERGKYLIPWRVEGGAGVGMERNRSVSGSLEGLVANPELRLRRNSASKKQRLIGKTVPI